MYFTLVLIPTLCVMFEEWFPRTFGDAEAGPEPRRALTVGSCCLHSPHRCEANRSARRSTTGGQTVESFQIEHQPVQRADPDSQVAVKVREHVRKHDEVLRVTT